MKLDFSGNSIKLSKELNDLDIFVADFISVLDRLEIKYVLISGYVAILFGRSRSSEDIDLFIEPIGKAKFAELWTGLSGTFECVNTPDENEAYSGYLKTKHSIRFSRKGRFIPNMELSFPKDSLDLFSLENRLKVELNSKLLFISPLELQISYKLFLSGEKDIEDARHLFKLFEGHIDLKKLAGFNKQLKVEKEFKKYLEG